MEMDGGCGMGKVHGGGTDKKVTGSPPVSQTRRRGGNFYRAKWKKVQRATTQTEKVWSGEL
jgi:hypothetical protein